MTSLVDIAGNMTNKAFASDRADVLRRAAKSGVGGIVLAGVSTLTARRAWEIVSDRKPNDGFPALASTSGIHPHNASSASPEALIEISEIAGKPGVVAIGECGLDYNRNFSPPDVQRRAFEAQLEIAVARRLPVYLHERDAHEDFVRILARYRPKLTRGVVHCFTGTRAILEAYLEMDLHIGLTGWICDERRGTHLRPLAALVPRGRLMVETDAPYILPRDLPNKPTSGRNEPAFVVHVAQAVAKYRNESFEELATHTTETAHRFFGFV